MSLKLSSNYSFPFKVSPNPLPFFSIPHYFPDVVITLVGPMVFFIIFMNASIFFSHWTRRSWKQGSICGPCSPGEPFHKGTGHSKEVGWTEWLPTIKEQVSHLIGASLLQQSQDCLAGTAMHTATDEPSGPQVCGHRWVVPG